MLTVHVRTPGRLHFGLWAPSSDRLHRFGGCGLMVRDGGVTLAARLASKSFVEPIGSAWACQRAVKLLDELGVHDVAISIENAPEAHVGLGSGTQLAFAVLAAVDRLRAEATHGLTPIRASDPREYARRSGRGARSSIGAHGFFDGGFLVDLGKPPSSDEPGGMLLRDPFPEDWPILLIRPTLPPGLHGADETAQFVDPQPRDADADRMARLLLAGIVPALRRRDYPTFADALHEYNRLAGLAFSPPQPGAYAHPLLQAIIEDCRRGPAPACGQSSWGPTLFAIAPDAAAADAVERRLREAFADRGVTWRRTFAQNVGAEVTTVCVD